MHHFIVVQSRKQYSIIYIKISTLRFGTRAKSIKTNFKMNMVLSPEKM